MTVSTFVQSDAETQTVNRYPNIVDANTSVMARLAAAFAPHEQTVPDMTVAIDAGHISAATTVLEIAPQTTETLTVPSAYPRIDRIVVSQTSGLASVVVGTEAENPVTPAIPSGKAPVAQVRLEPGVAAITNAMITDERTVATAPSAGGLIGVQVFSSSGTYVPTAGTRMIIVEVLGAGGSGGGCGACTSGYSAGAGGGGAGAYAKSLLQVDFEQMEVVVGSGGTPPTAGKNTGNLGGTSSFGSLITAPGGKGGAAGTPTTAFLTSGGSSTQSPATGGNIISASGELGRPGFAYGSTGGQGGAGGTSPFGGGGTGTWANDGLDSHTPGAGGGGGGTSSTARTGGTGGNGIVIITEYY